MEWSGGHRAQALRSAAPATIPDWRTAAAWWVRRELGAQANGLIRILDVCQIADREAWVSLEVAGRHVVIGLRHDVAGADTATFTADDGWYRLLYLTVIGDAESAVRDT